jgi:hypothetical protein
LQTRLQRFCNAAITGFPLEFVLKVRVSVFEAKSWSQTLRYPHKISIKNNALLDKIRIKTRFSRSELSIIHPNIITWKDKFMSIIALLNNLLKEKLPIIHATRLRALMAAV